MARPFKSGDLRTVENKMEAHKSHQMSKKMVDFSKYLSFVLRHGAEEVGVAMDKQGYVSVDELLKTKKAKGYTFNDLKSVVDNNNKKRFEMNEVEEEGKKVLKIRAVQGHTITVGFSQLRAWTKSPYLPK